MNITLETAADKLVKEIFGVKSGETVIITADDDSDASVVEAVKNSAKNAGAHAMVISVPTPGGVGKAADPDLPVDALSAALLCADVWIEFNHQWLLYSTPFERAEAENKKMRYMCLVDFNPDLMIRTIGNVETEQLKKFMLSLKKQKMRRTCVSQLRQAAMFHLRSIQPITQHVTAEMQLYLESICLRARSMLCRSLEVSME